VLIGRTYQPASSGLTGFRADKTLRRGRHPVASMSTSRCATASGTDQMVMYSPGRAERFTMAPSPSQPLNEAVLFVPKLRLAPGPPVAYQ